MFIDFQRALMTQMGLQIAAGKHLEGIELLKRGDQKPAAQFKQAITVDWNEKIFLKQVGNGWQPRGLVSIGLYTTDPTSEALADEKLQNLLWRENEAGQLLGLIPFLMALGGVRGDSRAYGFEVTPQMPRGSLSKPPIFRVATYVILEVWIKPITIENIQPL